MPELMKPNFDFIAAYESRARRADLIKFIPENKQFKHLPLWLAVNKERYEQALKIQKKNHNSC